MINKQIINYNKKFSWELGSIIVENGDSYNPSRHPALKINHPAQLKTVLIRFGCT